MTLAQNWDTPLWSHYPFPLAKLVSYDCNCARIEESSARVIFISVSECLCLCLVHSEQPLFSSSKLPLNHNSSLLRLRHDFNTSCLSSKNVNTNGSPCHRWRQKRARITSDWWKLVLFQKYDVSRAKTSHNSVLVRRERWSIWCS